MTNVEQTETLETEASDAVTSEDVLVVEVSSEIRAGLFAQSGSSCCPSCNNNLA